MELYSKPLHIFLWYIRRAVFKTIDKYIIKKFLGTFVYAIAIIICIVIVFDISEKLDDFLRTKASLHDIVFEYYLNFIPYFVNLFSSFNFSVHFYTFKGSSIISMN